MADHKNIVRRTSTDDLINATNFKWSESLTLQFITERFNMQKRFTGKRYSARAAWQIILRKLGLETVVTPEQCRKKWMNLNQKYKKFKNSPAGTSEDGQTATDWPYYELLDTILGGKELIKPTLLLSTIDGTLPLPSKILSDAEEHIPTEVSDEEQAEIFIEMPEVGVAVSPAPSSYTERKTKKRRLDSELLVDRILEHSSQEKKELLELIRAQIAQNQQFLTLLEKMIEKL